MKAIVIYDSVYGNTKTIALAIARGLPAGTTSAPVSVAREADVREADLVVLGAPTQGGRPTPAMKSFLAGLPKDALASKDVAVFDTRIDAQTCGAVPRFFLGVIGYAAGKLGKQVRGKGGRLMANPEGFLVMGKEGPLFAGEEQRAQDWARKLTPSSAGGTTAEAVKVA